MSETLLIAMLIALVGGIVSGLAGFGFGLVTVPLLLMLYPPATVTTVGSSLALASGWIVLLGTWRTVQVRTLQYDMQQFRGSITAYFYYVNCIGLSVLILRGIVGWEQLDVALRLLPAAIIGGFIGRRALRYVSQAQFRRITLIMLLLTGTTGIVTALQALVR
jgi:uncharacterized protein